MTRTAFSQTRHNKEVRRLANHYSRRGLKVYADISGFPQPQVINGYRPDLIVVGDDGILVIEVETEDSINSRRDIAQQRAFGSWARRSFNKEFEKVIV